VIDKAYRIRIAREDDMSTLAIIEELSFSDPWPASAFSSVLAMPSAHIVVATRDDDIPIGYCVLLTAADQGEIANLSVAKSARRRGVANALLQHALAYAKTVGVTAAYLEVRASNGAAQALYRANQFKEIGRRRGYYQRPPEDALVLQWTDASG
jgi:ribosomal-protein-alanine N-acetyltransferase